MRHWAARTTRPSCQDGPNSVTEDLERAEALAQKALTLNPATTRAYRVLSFINLFRKRYDLALAQIDRALEFNPSDADNYVQRGAVLVWAGRAAEALPWLEGALRFDRANGFAAASSAWRTTFFAGIPRLSMLATVAFPVIQAAIHR